MYIYILSLVAKANALKAELGLPPEIPAAQAISTACEIMQIVAEPNELLPSIADRVVAAVGRLRNRFVRSAPAPAPARGGGGGGLRRPFFLSRDSLFGGPLFLM